MIQQLLSVKQQLEVMTKDLEEIHVSLHFVLSLDTMLIIIIMNYSLKTSLNRRITMKIVEKLHAGN